MTKKSKEERSIIFIEKARQIHGDRYDYSKVKYTTLKNKVIITCKEHGDFLQTPNCHIAGSGCINCGVTKKINSLSSNSNDFIKKAKEIHGDKYDYSKVEYKKCNYNVIIICKKHGEFHQTPSSHLRNNGCKSCNIKIYNKNTTSKIRKTKEDFFEKAKQVHGDKYDYSKVEYKKIKEKVIIICKEHGEFHQTPLRHLNGAGCIDCGVNINANKKRSNKEEFIRRAKEIHGDKYDYSKVEYKKAIQKVIIICKEHGEFTKTPNRHLHERQGCPKCQEFGYSKVQIVWLDFLSKLYNINIQHAKNDTEFMIPNTKYKADGFCKETNTIFEFHGDYWHGNPNIFNPNTFNKTTKCSYGELYKRTIDREQCIKNAGFNLITIWESDWHKINKGISIIQREFRVKMQK